MREASPGHVGDVQQAVDAAEIDEGAVIGEVLDRAVENRALFEVLEGRRAPGVLLLFEDLLAGDDDVAALLVELDDADIDGLADVGVEIAHGTDFQLRAGQERLDADVDGDATLDAADHGAGDGHLLGVGLLDGIPNAVALRLLIAQQVAALDLLALHYDLDEVAGMELGLAGVVHHLLERDEAFAFEAHIYHHMLVRQLDHCALDDVVLIALRNGSFGGLLAVKGLQCRGKILHAHVFVCRFGSGDGGVVRLRLGGVASIAVVELGALVVVGGFGRRFVVFRRGIKRWGFQFGVQGFALGLFRM